MQKMAQALLNFFYPKVCVSCKKDVAYDSSRNLCDACFSSIRLVEGLICQVCGVPLPDGGRTCYLCKKNARAFDLVRAATIFEGAMRDMIHALKYEQQDGLALELSFWLAHQWAQTPELQSVDYLVPVPLHAQRQRERGYNQSELLARHFLSRIAKTKMTAPILKSDLLLRIKNRPAQMALSRAERQSNIEGAFAACHLAALQGKTVLVLDDVCTTAFTLNACAQALHAAGAKKVIGFVLSRD